MQKIKSSKNDDEEFDPTPDSQDCPYEQILGIRVNNNMPTEYYVKLRKEPYYKSVWLTASKLQKYQHSSSMLNRATRNGSSSLPSEPPFYDPSYDIVDKIIVRDKNRYLVKWMNLDYEECTWESKVESSVVNNYKKKLKEKFPQPKSDVSTEPSADFEPQVKYAVTGKELSSHQLACLNILIANYLDQKSSDIIEQLNMNLHISVAAFIQYSFEKCEEVGPYLIVTSPNYVRKWYQTMRLISRMTALEYIGSKESRAFINEKDFIEDGILKFHILVTSTEIFQQDIEKIAGIKWRAMVFADSQRLSSPYSKYQKLVAKIDHGHQISICNTTAIHFLPDLQRITDFFLSTKKIMNGEKNIKAAEELKALLNTNTQKRAKRSIIEIQNDINPYYVDCPLNHLQKEVVKKIITTNLDDLKRGVCLPTCQLIYRIIDHPFLIFKEEYKLKGVDFLDSSTKLQVISQLIDDALLKNQRVMLISHFSLMLDLIEDCVNLKKLPYSRVSNHSNEIENTDATIFLYNPDFCSLSPNAIEIVEIAVIIDGFPANFMELLKENRSSRVEHVYFLQCSECSEAELSELCRSRGLDTFHEKEKNAEKLAKYTALHAFSDSPTPPISHLITSYESAPFGVNESSLIADELGDCDFWGLLVEDTPENDTLENDTQENELRGNNAQENEGDEEGDEANETNETNEFKNFKEKEGENLLREIKLETDVIVPSNETKKESTAGIVGKESLENVSKVKSEFSGVGASSSSRNDDLVEHCWTVRERDQLFRNLFRLGWNRWKDLIEIAGLVGVSESEVIRASRALLREIIRSSGSNTGHQLSRDFIRETSTGGQEEKDVERDRKFIDSSVFRDPQFKHRVHKQGPTLLKKIEALHYICTVQSAPQTSKRGFRSSICPSEWWNDDLDNILIAGTIKYGLGCYDHYAEDNDPKMMGIFGYDDDDEAIEQKRFNDRLTSLGEGLKRAKMKQEEQAEKQTPQEIFERNQEIEKKFTKEEQSLITNYLKKSGIDINEEGDRDFEALMTNCGISNKTADEIREYIENFMFRCEMPSPDDSGIRPKTAKNVLETVKHMQMLRTILFDMDRAKAIKFFEIAPKWRLVPENWSPEYEYMFFDELSKRGFGTMTEILNSDAFKDNIKNPPSFLTRNKSVWKRIACLSECKHKKFEKKKSSMNSNSMTLNQSNVNGGNGSENVGNISNNPNMNSNASSMFKGGDLFTPSISYEMLESGNFEFPIQVTATTEIWSIGKVVYDRPGFHNQRYVYADGYRVSKYYTSALQPSIKTKWFSEIIDTGEEFPCFRVWMEEQPNVIYSGQTPTAPWTQALKQISKKSNGKPVSVSGPEFFLLGNQVVNYLIQKLDNIDKLPLYKAKDSNQLMKYLREHFPRIQEPEPEQEQEQDLDDDMNDTKTENDDADQEQQTNENDS